MHSFSLIPFVISTRQLISINNSVLMKNENEGHSPPQNTPSYFFLEYTATSVPIIPSSIPNPGVPLVVVASGVGVGSLTVPESGVATGSTALDSSTCPSIINVENPGVGDEYW